MLYVETNKFKRYEKTLFSYQKVIKIYTFHDYPKVQK